MKRWIASSRWPRWLARGAVSLALACVAGFVAFQAAVAWWPYPEGIDRLPEPATFILDREGQPLAALVSSGGQWQIPLACDSVNPHLRDAIVAVEDSRFYAHHGVDWRSAASAAWEDLSHLHLRRGASTLTMQVQRLREPAARSLLGKFEQAVRACQIEKRISKEQIIVEYLNRAPFGGNLVGAEAASWRYFGRPCAALSLGQCALLAGLPQNPNRLRPDRFPQRALQRREHVLGRMLACGMISDSERAQAAAEPIDAAWRPLPQMLAAGGMRAESISTKPVLRYSEGPDSSTVDPALRSTSEPAWLENSQRSSQAVTVDPSLPVVLALARAHRGERLLTTLDAALERQAAAVAIEHVRTLHASGVCGAAVVILDTPTSQVLASVSVDLAARRPGMDLAAQPRSSGSTLKPFIYAAAFDAGICQPRSMLLDAPAAWPGYAPRNFDHEFRGPLSAAEALAQSRNIPAMVLLAKVGVERSVGMMSALGLRSLGRHPRTYGLPLAIGGAEVTPLELAGAYATLARGGLAREVTLVSPDAQPSEVVGGAANEVVLGSANRLRSVETGGNMPTQAWDMAPMGPSAPGLSSATEFRMHPEVVNSGPLDDLTPIVAAPVLRPRACWDALIALSSPQRTAHVCPEAAGLHVAWKTGTSSGRRDAWCAAVTPRRTVVVWLGNPSGRGADCLVGIDAAAPLALRLMASIDTSGLDWPADERRDRTGGSVEAATGGAPTNAPPLHRLVLVCPAPNDQFFYNPQAGGQQQIPFRATGVEGEPLWWFVDGKEIGTGLPSETRWWTPLPGEHHLRVFDAKGDAAAVKFAVR